MCVHVCACVDVCVGVRERDRERNAKDTGGLRLVRLERHSWNRCSQWEGMKGTNFAKAPDRGKSPGLYQPFSSSVLYTCDVEPMHKPLCMQQHSTAARNTQ